MHDILSSNENETYPTTVRRLKTATFDGLDLAFARTLPDKATLCMIKLRAVSERHFWDNRVYLVCIISLFSQFSKKFKDC